MLELFPELDCNRSFYIDADIHRIYIEECGNGQGIPVIFLHGGPGSGCNENHRRYFDPEQYRIIIFDQRGSNRSAPQGCIENNTTDTLIRDLERIRQHLSINKWLIFGGSWGATLGLLYAETCPEQVTGMVLRGTFLARKADLEWFAGAGVNRIFPDYWKEFTEVIPAAERNDLVSAYYSRVIEGDRATKEKFARAWSQWAGRVVTYTLPEVKEEDDINTTINQVSIETHYAKNRYFLRENQILENVGSIPKVPVIIIHGRRDLTCTLEASWSLHQALPQSEFIIVKDGGHLAGEPPMVDALVTATNRMATLLA